MWIIAGVIALLLLVGITVGISVGVTRDSTPSDPPAGGTDNIPKGATLTGYQCRSTGSCGSHGECDYESGLCYTL